jgi:uncharacterized protein Yka (UPF0111/DUF47 family)
MLAAMKSQILAAIGEPDIQPAAALNAALAANDRLKYFFSLLQMACGYGAHPEQEAATLHRERLACGVDDADLDRAIASARMAGSSCHIAGAANIIARLAADLRIMAAPLIAAKSESVAPRLAACLAGLPAAADDLVDPDAISAMMRAGHGAPDSPHRLVMDMHKALNAMLAGMATESLDGASVFNLAAADRPLVAAFMAGINRTAQLKFDHPGLATTATRTADKLLIQNDIGTTDAHVIVIHVDALEVMITYTDVHAERVAFFQSLLKPLGMTWEGTRTSVLAAGTAFYLITGRLAAKSPEAVAACLETIGRRLVFLIDWNHARKQLRSFLRAPDRLALLLWAAETEIGHRGFLESGGAHLINQAIEASAGASMHFGDRLCDVLGDTDTQDFMRIALRTATEGLLSGQSQALIHDRVRATLAGHFTHERAQLLARAEDHAGLIFELASAVRDGLQPDAGDSAKRAKRARGFEHDADHFLMETRQAVRRRPEFSIFLALMEAADEVADQLEDAVFLLDLDRLRGKPLETLRGLAELLVADAQEWIKALGHARRIGGAPGQTDIEDFLAAIDRIATIEHQADDAARALTETAYRHAEDFRQLHLYNSAGGKLEAAADALKQASLILRDDMLDMVIDG